MKMKNLKTKNLKKMMMKKVKKAQKDQKVLILKQKVLAQNLQ